MGDIRLRINTVVSDVPAADHKHVQGNGFCPPHGAAMTSMHKVYTKILKMLEENLHYFRTGLEAKQVSRSNHQMLHNSINQ